MESNPIIPDNKLLKVAIYLLTMITVYPLELKHHPKLRLIYRGLSNFILAVLTIFIITEWTQAAIFIKNRRFLRFMHNMGQTLLLSIGVLRGTFVRGKVSMKLINTIYETEEKLLTCKDEDIINIYMRAVESSRRINWFFCVLGIITTIPFFYQSMSEEVHRRNAAAVTNASVNKDIEILLPVSTWYPFNIQDNFMLIFSHQTFCGFFIAGNVVYVDGFMFSLFYFAITRLKILQHILRNFRTYVNKIQKQLDVDDNASARATIRACVEMHKEIIEYVGAIDNAFRMIMLLDFLSCSVQMGVLIYQIMVYEFGLSMVHATEFLISMLLQLFFFYWIANEIIFESEKVGDAIWGSDWYNEKYFVKQSMLIIMHRSQKPLTLTIGGLYPMTNETMVSIMKATYSYGMLLHNTLLE